MKVRHRRQCIHFLKYLNHKIQVFKNTVQENFCEVKK